MTVEIRMFCDQCQDRGPTGGTAYEARWIAKRDGWSMLGNRDLCPACTADHMTDQAWRKAREATSNPDTLITRGG